MPNGKEAHLHVGPKEHQILRYTPEERVCHWFTAGTYVYCMVTGLALFTPYLYWLAFVVGGGPTARFWHPIIGILFVVGIFWMHMLWRDEFNLSSEDRIWLDKVKYYVKNEDDLLPPQGKYDAGQKIYYWGMFYGSILLILSGLVMWAPEYVPRGWHWALPLVAFVHEGAALITIGAIILHVYMAVFTVPGSVTAMTTGYVSRGWAMLHARLWYDKVESGAVRRT
ncbi:MAG TPA: formate dehydrogenase subunit gamma [Terriglobales bacterium]|nr:formate dehydrogenase subunit gamma [Terriglobales bacterium]